MREPFFLSFLSRFSSVVFFSFHPNSRRLTEGGKFSSIPQSIQCVTSADATQVLRSVSCLEFEVNKERR